MLEEDYCSPLLSGLLKRVKKGKKERKEKDEEQMPLVGPNEKKERMCVSIVLI